MAGTFFALEICRQGYSNDKDMTMDESEHTNTYYASLKRSMMLKVIAVSFTPMLLVICIMLYEFSSSYHEKVTAHLQELVMKHKQKIDGFLNRSIGDIRFLGDNFTIKQLGDESFLNRKFSSLQKEYGNLFSDLEIVDNQGRLISYAGPFKFGNVDYSGADWFKQAYEKNNFISDVFLGVRGLPHFIVSVHLKNGGALWIIRATINFESFNDMVGEIRSGKTGFAFILNRAGQLQTKPGRDLVPDQDIYTVLWDLASGSTEPVQYLKRKNLSSGIETLYVPALLKDGDWLLVFQQINRDAIGVIYRVWGVALIIFLAGGCGILFVSHTMSAGLVSRVMESDKAKESLNDQVIESGKLASIGELAAGIAHEINNPVAIMVEEAGWIQDLLEEEAFKESTNLKEFGQAVKQIQFQGQRCKDITYKLLSFARRTGSRIEDLDVNGVIQEIIDLSAQRAKFSNITIETDLQKDIPLIRASYTEVQQIFMNLINNAVDAMEKKGGILKVANSFKGHCLLVRVADTGPGIPQSNLSRIFDPFFTTKPVGKGTGLGLSICYGIINKMGGEIKVRSTVGEGTAFEVCLPVSDQAKKTDQ